MRSNQSTWLSEFLESHDRIESADDAGNSLSVVEYRPRPGVGLAKPGVRSHGRDGLLPDLAAGAVLLISLLVAVAVPFAV